jgi:hypothetical protein
MDRPPTSKCSVRLRCPRFATFAKANLERGKRRLEGGDTLGRMPGDCASRRRRPCLAWKAHKVFSAQSRVLLDLPAAQQSCAVADASGESLVVSPPYCGWGRQMEEQSGTPPSPSAAGRPLPESDFLSLHFFPAVSVNRATSGRAKSLTAGPQVPEPVVAYRTDPPGRSYQPR